MSIVSRPTGMATVSADFNLHMGILLKHAQETGSHAIRAETHIDFLRDKIQLVVVYDLASREDVDKWQRPGVRDEVQKRFWECMGIPAPSPAKPLRIQRRLMLARASAAKRTSPRRKP